MVVAVMLWLALRRETTPQAIAESVNPARPEDSILRVSAAESTVPATDTPAPTSLESFTVQLRPLQYDAMDALVLARVNEYYAAFADGLRAVPGLHLVDDQAPADFRVTISNPYAADTQQASLSSEWAARASVEVLKGGSGGRSGPTGTVYVLGMVGDAWRGSAPAGVEVRGPLSGGCEKPGLIPCSPADIAARQVMALRKKVFPRDESLERGLEARMFDAGLPERERDMAMSEVLSMKMALNDATVREVLTRMSYTQGVHERRNLLALLAGQRREAIVQPLIDIARNDSDATFRTGAVRMLAADYPRDPAARATLEEIAADPSNPTLQGIAEGALRDKSEN